MCNQFSPIRVCPRLERNNSELINSIPVRISNRETNYSKSLTKIKHQLKPIHQSNVINIYPTNRITKNAINTNRKDRIYIFLSNVRSLLPKVDDLQTTLKLHGADLAFITETWLNESIDDAAVQLQNYIIVRRDRMSRTGGGVCAYINSCIPYKVLHELHDDDFETLWIYIRPQIGRAHV